MLPSDVCLYKNVKLNVANPDLEGFSDCEFAQCPDSPRADIVRQFAEVRFFFAFNKNKIAHYTALTTKLTSCIPQNGVSQ